MAGEASRVKKRSEERAENCGKTGHTWSECWAKCRGAAKQANSVGETEKTGDVKWIMMIQQPSDGQPITMGHEAMFLDFGFLQKRTRVSHWQSRCVRMRNIAESDYVLPNSNIAGSHPIQQSTVDVAHQPDIRPESVNPVTLSSTAKLAVATRQQRTRLSSSTTAPEMSRAAREM